MNWEMAKNWLIVSFLLLDLVLGWQVLQSRREMNSYAESYSDQVASTRTLLAEHGLSLNAQVPTTHPNMAFVRADFETPSLQDILKSAFPNDDAYTLDVANGIGQCNDGTLKLLDKGEWNVSYSNPPKVSSNDLSSITPLLWNGQDYRVDEPLFDGTTASGNAAVHPVFIMHFQSFPFFDASVKATVKNNTLVGYRQVYLINIASSGDKKPTITALDALNNLANAVDKTMLRKDNRILNLELGYYHKLPNSAGDSQALPTSTYWFPVWRVVTASQVFYVNAFTGEVEIPS